MPTATEPSPAISTAHLVERFGIDHENIKWRQRAVCLDESDRHTLLPMVSWAKSVAPSLVKDYFDTMFAVSPLRENYERWARDQNISFAELRTRLETLRQGYFISIFEDAAHNWGLAHIEQILRFGLSFRENNVAPKFYMSFWFQFQRQTGLHLRATISDSEQRLKIEQSLAKVLNYHLQLLNDSFLLSTLEGMGLDLTGLQCAIGRDPTEHLDQVTAAMKARVSTLASAAEELTSTSKQMRLGAEEAAKRAQELSSASTEVSDNVSNVAASSDRLQGQITEIANRTNEATRIAKRAVAVAESTNQTMSELASASSEIGKVMKVITSIAQQTNLLALNATIEAARAGEAGKGFAVVANEVKELAKGTALATEEISHKIEAIQGGTKNAVQTIRQVGEIISQINEISNAIAYAVEAQTVNTNEISRNVQQAAERTAEIARNTATVASVARDTANGTIEMQNAARSLTEMAAAMGRYVARARTGV